MLTVNNYSSLNYGTTFTSKFSNLKKILAKNGLYEKGMTIEEMERVVSKYGLNNKSNNNTVRKCLDKGDYVEKHNNYKEQDLPKNFRLGKQF